MSLLPITQIQSQSPNIYDYGVHVRVKPGDSEQFTYTKILVQGNNYFNYTDSINIGVVDHNPFKVTQGTIMTATVTNVSSSGISGQEQVIGNQTFETPDGRSKTYNNSYLSGFIIPGFDNKTMVDYFLGNLTSYSSGSNAQYTSDNNFIYGESGYNYSVSQNVSIIQNQTLVLNWHTGWLEKSESVQKYSNGTIFYNVRIERVTNDIVGNIYNFGSNLIVFGLPLAFGGIIIFAFLNYKKDLASNSTNNEGNSFFNYIKKDFKKKPKSSTSLKPKEINKSLEIIDDILKDSEINK